MHAAAVLRIAVPFHRASRKESLASARTTPRYGRWSRPHGRTHAAHAEPGPEAQALYRPKEGILNQLDAPNSGLGAQTEVAAGAGPARERGRRSFAAGCMRRRRAPLQTRPTDGPRHRRLGTHRKSPVPTSIPWRVRARGYGIISAKAKHATIVTLVRRRPETFEIAGCRPKVHQSIEAPGSP